MKNKIVKPVGSISNITLQEMMNTGWHASLGPLQDEPHPGITSSEAADLEAGAYSCKDPPPRPTLASATPASITSVAASSPIFFCCLRG